MCGVFLWRRFCQRISFVTSRTVSATDRRSDWWRGAASISGCLGVKRTSNTSVGRLMSPHFKPQLKLHLGFHLLLSVQVSSGCWTEITRYQRIPPSARRRFLLSPVSLPLSVSVFFPPSARLVLTFCFSLLLPLPSTVPPWDLCLPRLIVTFCRTWRGRATAMLWTVSSKAFSLVETSEVLKDRNVKNNSMWGIYHHILYWWIWV